MSDSKITELFQQARKQIKERNIAEAVETYQRILSIKPAEKKAHAGIAAAYFQLKQYQDAISHFQDLARLSPADASPYINMGAIYNKMGEYKQALNELRKAVQKDKKSADAFYNMGIAHKGLNQLSMAVTAYKQAIVFDPDMVDAHFNLGNVYLEMKNHTQAHSSFTRSLEISPQFKKALNALKKLDIESTKEKENFNPFGRLVDETSLRKKDTSISTKQLSTEERQKDRVEIHQLCEEIKEVALSMVEDLKKGFTPNLLNLNRCISQGEKHYSELAEANESFLKTVKTLNDMRKLLRHRVLELRAHEELINSIGLD
ncbi:tetratricopeptide repeat protein [Gimesia fumaroli]|uniref:TPR repeat-containing protein YrrB n=1 Tax=Gimesia fumaroli TaxID=2527976 RepID=A0A518IDD6_9PLAN|nr:tetratricopeptide repeat protein [Gimesia fumaroli]QDV51084.1 TPR repeat-containing protein YrrB [Gimesia fumaroli]